MHAVDKRAEESTEDEGSDAEETPAAPRRSRAKKPAKTYSKEVQDFLDYVAKQHKQYSRKTTAKKSQDWHTNKDLHYHMWNLRKVIGLKFVKNPITEKIENILAEIEQYEQNMIPEVSNDARLSISVARSYLRDPTGAEQEETDDSQGAGAGASIAPEPAQPGKSKAASKQPTQQRTQVTQAQVQNALENLRKTKFNLDMEYVRMNNRIKGRKHRKLQDSDEEDTEQTELNELGARIQELDQQRQQLKQQLENESEPYSMLVAAELYQPPRPA
jgi:hypothetical protein